jgi:hypothetical protein
VRVSLQFKARVGFGQVRLDSGCNSFRTLFRVGSGLFWFFKLVYNCSKGLARRFIYDWLKTLLVVAGWLACLLVG